MIGPCGTGSKKEYQKGTEMRIKLTESLPVDPKYNMVRDRILEVVEVHKHYGRGYISDGP